MKYLALIHNWFIDFDFCWWPFSILKPLPHELITWKKVTHMSLCFGLLIWGFIAVYSLLQTGLNLSFLLTNLFASVLSLFLWFGLVTKPLWNYRARRLGR